MERKGRKEEQRRGNEGGKKGEDEKKEGREEMILFSPLNTILTANNNTQDL